MSEPDVFTAAVAVVDAVRDGLMSVRDTEFWKVPDLQLLALARDLEMVARLAFTAQVHLAGEIDTRGIAAAHGASSTAALLRTTLGVSPGDARALVAAAAVVLPRDVPSGGELPPVLPLLADAVDEGGIGIAQTRTVVGTMSKLPAGVDEATRAVVEEHLVGQGRLSEPAPFANFARTILLTLDQDGRDFDEDPPADHMEFTLGTRNPNTGLTRFTGQLDDLSVEVINQVIDALSKPVPGHDTTGSNNPSGGGGGGNGGRGNGGGGNGGSGGGGRGGKWITDPRPAPTRRAQALIEALRRYLDLGDAPIQGGERPHVTVTMTLQDLLGGGINGASVGGGVSGICSCPRTGGEESSTGASGPGTGTGIGIGIGGNQSGAAGTGGPGRAGTRSAVLEYGGPITAAQARMLACDARIIPAVLGTASQVLDVGTANRLFPPAIRRAIALRDKGCSFPGCDRPPGWTDAHHVSFWIDDGKTAYDNGTLLCRAHHSEIHRGHWTIHFAADGVPEYTAPPWVDPTRTPRRNTFHHIPTLLRP